MKDFEEFARVTLVRTVFGCLARLEDQASVLGTRT